jgi:hypothetical protein
VDASSGTTYIYTTSSGSGAVSYTVNIPSSGAYTMTASVSAPNGSSNTWTVQIQGVSDTNNVSKNYTVVNSLGTPLHTETVNDANAGIRYWNLNAGNDVVVWSGRGADCALACFNLGQASSSFLPTVTPIPTNTQTPTPTPNQGGSARDGETPTETITPTVTPWNGSTVVAAPNISVNGTPIEFRVNLSGSSDIHLTLYNLLGEKVYSQDQAGNSGLNTLTWTLDNLNGTQVASGLYIYQVRVGAMVYGGKVVVIH